VAIIAKVRAPAAPMGLSFDSIDGDRPGRESDVVRVQLVPPVSAVSL
jgi:hypothetical protein